MPQEANMSSVTTASIAAGVPSPAARRARSDRWFFSGAAIAQVVLIVAGFAPTYYLKGAYGTPPLSPLLHVHGLVFTTWLVLLLVQTTLVAARRTRVHRRLGMAGGWLAGVMMVVGYLAGVDAARRGATIPGMTPQAFLIIPLSAIAVFVVLVAAALWLRRRPDYHKRLMTIATAELLSAGVARIPAIVPLGPLGFFGVPDLFVVAMAVYDLVTLRRIHPATIAGGLFLIATQPLRLMVSGTDSWVAIATWLTS